MEIRTVGVLGAGTMGNGIAHVFARSGFEVLLCDVQQGFLDRALETISKNLEREVAKNKISADERQAALRRIRPTTELASLKGCDFVVEAATEKFAIKQQLFGQLDRIGKQTRFIDKPELFGGISAVHAPAVDARVLRLLVIEQVVCRGLIDCSIRPNNVYKAGEVLVHHLLHYPAFLLAERLEGRAHVLQGAAGDRPCPRANFVERSGKFHALKNDAHASDDAGGLRHNLIRSA